MEIFKKLVNAILLEGHIIPAVVSPGLSEERLCPHEQRLRPPGRRVDSRAGRAGCWASLHPCLFSNRPDSSCRLPWSYLAVDPRISPENTINFSVFIPGLVSKWNITLLSGECTFAMWNIFFLNILLVTLCRLKMRHFAQRITQTSRHINIPWKVVGRR